MSFQPSTAKEILRCQAMVRLTEWRMRRLLKAGKKVHVIWDVDHVLVSGRSEDVFTRLKFDVAKYFQYEERLITQILEDGPWLPLARLCGQLHQSQDIVTARSSFLAMRVMFFLLRHDLPIRWQLFVGHQPKSESYRIILKSFEKDLDVHVFSIDDAKKHNDAFDAVAAEMSMSDRCHSVLAPQIRLHDERDIVYEVERVLDSASLAPYVIEPPRQPMETAGRYVRVTPDSRKTIANMLWRASSTAEERAFVEQNRALLERLADEICPGRPKTDELLIVLREAGLPP